MSVEGQDQAGKANATGMYGKGPIPLGVGGERLGECSRRVSRSSFSASLTASLPAPLHPVASLVGLLDSGGNPKTCDMAPN